MVQIISGPKGSGKTKRIIDFANSKVNETMGEVVFINDREKYRERLNTGIRYVNIEEFYIHSVGSMFGFLNGMIAENYDIDTIYVDNLLRITKVNSINELDEFFEGLKQLSNKYHTEFVISVTSEIGEEPEFLKEFAWA